jgi:hypothetical protein
LGNALKFRSVPLLPYLKKGKILVPFILNENYAGKEIQNGKKGITFIGVFNNDRS